MPSRIPTSVRFSLDEMALIEAHAARLADSDGRPCSHTDVIRFLLKERQPHPSALGATESQLRVAYTAVFGKTWKERS